MLAVTPGKMESGVENLTRGGNIMTRKVLTIVVFVVAVGALLTSMALAGNALQKGKTSGKAQNSGICPYGNTPQGGKVQGKANGHGPGDGTGNGGNGPKDGTGYGPGSKGDGTGTGICDGTGPKGKVNKGKSTKAANKQNKRVRGHKGGRK